MITEPVNPVAPPPSMSAADAHLLKIAQDLLGRVWVHGRHEVATALRAADGSIHTGVHLEGSCRRSSNAFLARNASPISCTASSSLHPQV